MFKALNSEEGVNPYIALADLTLNLVFILVFFVAAVLAIGQVGWDQVKYRDAQKEVLQAIEAAPLSERPQVLLPALRNDPPGAQRWAFAGRSTPLFMPTTVQLTPLGERNLLEFARALNRVRSWRRIRIEGHTLPPKNKSSEWTLSALRASVVADLFATQAGIPPYFLVVAARGSQVKFNGDDGKADDPANERVEIVVEYAQPQISQVIQNQAQP